MNKKTILMSPTDSNLCEFFKKRYNIISTDCLKRFISYEQHHADMQAIRIKDKLFVNSDCINLISLLNKNNISFIPCENIGGRYPENIALNAALVGNKLICLEKALHPRVKIYCTENNIEIINTKQGYTKCSTLILNENSIITDDISIYNSATKAKINALLIEKDNIYLDGKTQGFIGGASFKAGETVYFFGDINTHKNADKIIDFITNNNLNIECINSDTLKDIGGIIELD